LATSRASIDLPLEAVNLGSEVLAGLDGEDDDGDDDGEDDEDDDEEDSPAPADSLGANSAAATKVSAAEPAAINHGAASPCAK
jgi:hypothetical protein